MIQDIAPLKLDNRYFPDKQPKSDSLVFLFRGSEALTIRRDGEPFPTFEDMGRPEALLYLFAVGERDVFLLSDEPNELPEGSEFAAVRALRRSNSLTNVQAFTLFTAYHLAFRYRASRFCGCCGAPTEIYSKERAVKCTSCGSIIYPRIDPAVIVGVTNGDKLLITRYEKSRGVFFDALIGGYAEIGETLEQTVEREVMEEVGLRVKNIRYYGSQPWGSSGTMLTGFFCDVDGSDEITVDTSELESAIWVSREDITGQPDDMSLTHNMMMAFKS